MNNEMCFVIFRVSETHYIYNIKIKLISIWVHYREQKSIYSGC